MWRKYKINENYFNKIDNDIKSYFLGILMSDGNVYNNKISITLIEEDKYILEKFRDIIYDELKPKLYFLDLNSKNKNHNNVYRLTICSKKISEDLLKYNIKPNKTMEINFPDIKDEYLSSFLRGYFDGDGSFYFRKSRNNSLIWQLVGTYDFLKILKIKLEEKLKIKIGMYKTSNSEVFELKISDKESVIKISKMMYENCNLYMKRKKEKFDNFIDNYEPTKRYSKIKGITFDKSRNKWKAQLYQKGKTFNIGRYKTENEAIEKLNKFRKENKI